MTTGGRDGRTVTDQRRGADLRLDQVRRAEARSRADGPWSLEHLTVCWVALVVATVVMAVVAAAVSGAPAAVSVTLGGFIVGAFFTISAVAIAKVGRYFPKAVLATALVVYVIKIVLLGAVVVGIPRDGFIQTRWMAGAVGIGLLVWMGAHLRYVWTAKIFYTDPDVPATEGPAEHTFGER